MPSGSTRAQTASPTSSAPISRHSRELRHRFTLVPGELADFAVGYVSHPERRVEEVSPLVKGKVAPVQFVVIDAGKRAIASRFSPEAPPHRASDSSDAVL